MAGSGTSLAIILSVLTTYVPCTRQQWSSTRLTHLLLRHLRGRGQPIAVDDRAVAHGPDLATRLAGLGVERVHLRGDDEAVGLVILAQEPERFDQGVGRQASRPDHLRASARPSRWTAHHAGRDSALAVDLDAVCLDALDGMTSVDLAEHNESEGHRRRDAHALAGEARASVILKAFVEGSEDLRRRLIDPARVNGVSV